MYKICKTEQSATRQRELEEGLLAAMSSRHYEEISVSDLCNHCGIPRKSFYRYFSSKDGALRALVDHTLLQFEGFTPDGQREEARTLHGDLERFFKFWIYNKPLLDALERSGLSGVLIERCITHALSETVMPKRFLPQDTPEIQRQITMFGVCGLMSMVLIWHHEGYPQSVSKMADIASRLIGQPLFPDVEKFM